MLLKLRQVQAEEDLDAYLGQKGAIGIHQVAEGNYGINRDDYTIQDINNQTRLLEEAQEAKNPFSSLGIGYVSYMTTVEWLAWTFAALLIFGLSMMFAYSIN